MAQYLTYRNGRFEWLGGYDTKLIPKDAKFIWDVERRRWWTDDPTKAESLKQYCDPSAAEALNAWYRHQQAELDASMATDADIHVPAPPGLAYLGYQKAGIAYAMRREATLLADEMGLGKTIQAIGVANAMPELRRILVVCPASLKINWARELDKWLVNERLTIGIVRGGDWPQTDVIIINYDIVERHLRNIHGINWDLLILDEAHYVKNPDAKRTQAIMGVKRWNPDAREWIVTKPAIDARRRLALTGTPILNRPQEMWTLVDFCLRHVPVWKRPQYMRSKSKFWERYAGYREGYRGYYEFTGPQNLDELRQECRRLFMIRRLKSQVLTDLPPKIRQVVQVPSDAYRDVIEREWAAQKAKAEQLALARAKMLFAKAAGTEDEYREAVRELREAQAVAFEEMSRVRHEVGLATLDASESIIESILDGGKKVVFFAHHRDVIEKLRDLCAEHIGKDKVVVLYGGMSESAKDSARERFQRDKSVQVFIGSIMAAGVGLTLTAASHVVFLELDWVPANVAQAEDRLHRIGQEEPVLVQHLVLEGSLTARMAQVVVEKQRTIEEAMDGDYSNPYAGEVVTAADADNPGGVAVSRERIHKEAESIPERHVVLIRSFIRYLASACDYADRRDDCGFNKYDAVLGHRLAGIPDVQFTPRVAVLAKALCRKYHRQLVSEFGGDAYETVYGAPSSERKRVRNPQGRDSGDDPVEELFRLQSL